MNAMKIMRTLKKGQLKYANADDFAEIFAEDMHSLFELALLLTADMVKAEECFVCALEECLDGMDSFPGWARSWARRSIVKHAIRIISPTRNSCDALGLINPKWPAALQTNNMIRTLSLLNAFERFAFVLLTLERQSDKDCSLLLGCRRQDLELARTSAISNLSRSGAGDIPAEEAKNCMAGSATNCRGECFGGSDRLASFGKMHLRGMLRECARVIEPPLFVLDRGAVCAFRDPEATSAAHLAGKGTML